RFSIDLCRCAAAHSYQEDGGAGGKPVRAEQLFDVKGLAVIVTGAASGIGLACAKVLAANGARVTLMDKDAGKLESALRDLPEGSDARSTLVDVTDRAALERAFAAAAAAHGRIDVVFANAGIGGGPGFLGLDGQRRSESAFESISEERWHSVVD